MTLPDSRIREVALSLLDPDRERSEDDEELALSNDVMAIRIQQETHRPLTLIGARELTRWHAWFCVDAARSRVEASQYARKAKQRR